MMDRHVDQESITSFAIFLHAACFISATTMFFCLFFRFVQLSEGLSLWQALWTP